jgi:alpha-D-xyloside xylohydrolase
MNIHRAIGAGFRVLPVLSLLALPATVRAHPQNERSFRLDVHNNRMELAWYAPGILRVTVSPDSSIHAAQSLSVTAAPAHVRGAVKRGGESITLSSAAMSVRIDRKTGEITFYDGRGSAFLTAQGPGAGSFAKGPSGEAYSVTQHFTLSEEEGLYGLGQFEDPVVNYRGRDILLEQANRTAVNPFLVSTRGYGILWDNYSRSRFADGGGMTLFQSEVADAIDYYVVYGPAADRVIAGYRLLTGTAPLPGKWALGYWQSKERYTSGSELTGIVREYRRRGLPLDNIVQDWAYWGGMQQFSSMMWDSASYPDPVRITDTLHALHAHFMVSIWPAFGTGTAIYRDMDARKFLFPVIHWNGGKVYDAYNPAARDLYWKYVKRGLFDNGVDAYWMDATEPEFRCSDDRYITEISLKEAGKNALGSFARYLTPYSLMTTRAVYENHRLATDRKRVFILTRSSFAGQQRYGAATWSGDTFATWDDLRVQIAAGINFSTSGIPYWSHDIGAFITNIHFPGGLSDPAYRELYVRWFQFGAFSPIFRAHGTNISREIWRFGEPGGPAYDALAASDRLRYRLMPYIYSTAWRVTHDGYSFIRGLPMAYPGDRNVYPIAGQYMFGSSLMVCPVTRPMWDIPIYRGVDITPGHFYSADGTEHGCELQVYRGTSFDSLILTRKTDASQISWTGCLPAGLDTAYSLRISGGIMTDARAGSTTFYVITDGGIRLWLDDRIVIDKPENREGGTFTFAADLAPGTKHPFLLEHRQFRPNNALLKLNWLPPDGPPEAAGTEEVYLPGGAAWYDFWTGKEEKGGKAVRADAPLAHLPLFVPSGSILPLGPDIQYAEEKVNAPTELRVYPGADADFTLYDDAGDTYDYEKGMYAVIPLHWNEARRTLTVGDQKGTYPGSPATREFTVVVVRDGHGAGGELTASPDTRIVYRGKRLTVRP